MIKTPGKWPLSIYGQLGCVRVEQRVALFQSQCLGMLMVGIGMKKCMAVF